MSTPDTDRLQELTEQIARIVAARNELANLAALIQALQDNAAAAAADANTPVEPPTDDQTPAIEQSA